MARYQRGELFALDLQPLGDTHVQSARDRGDDSADRERRMPDDAAASSRAAGSSASCGTTLLTSPISSARAGEKGVAGQQQFERALAPGEPRQALRAAERRRHAEIDFRFGEIARARWRWPDARPR